MSFILGINAFHGDSTTYLLQNEIILTATEEERFRRIKHWAGFPSESIRYCLAEAGISLAQVDHIAINQDGRANLGKKLAYTLTKRPDLGMVLDRLRNKRERAGVADHLATAFPQERFTGKVHQVEHLFRDIKRQFGFVKVRCRGLKKNTAQLLPLFALSNLLMVRGKLMGVQT